MIFYPTNNWCFILYVEFNDLYMFGWNESGQLAQATNLARPAECFSAVEKLLMACCTMQVRVNSSNAFKTDFYFSWRILMHTKVIYITAEEWYWCIQKWFLFQLKNINAYKSDFYCSRKMILMHSKIISVSAEEKYQSDKSEVYWNSSGKIFTHIKVISISAQVYWRIQKWFLNTAEEWY